MSTSDTLSSYEARLAPAQAELVRLLRAEIDGALPDASSKVWHGHPVWFDGENPVVGYDARKASVNLLFWNGQALGEAELVPVGKHRAAGRSFETAAQVDPAALRRWLEKARTNVLDSASYFRELREAARRTVKPAPSRAKATIKAKRPARRPGKSVSAPSAKPLRKGASKGKPKGLSKSAAKQASKNTRKRPQKNAAKRSAKRTAKRTAKR